MDIEELKTQLRTLSAWLGDDNELPSSGDAATVLDAIQVIESLQRENTELKNRLGEVLHIGTHAQVELLKANEERHATEGIVEEYRNVDRKQTAYIANLKAELEEARKIPEGFWLAPLDPTSEMVDAASDIDGPETAMRVWYAMQNTSPD